MSISFLMMPLFAASLHAGQVSVPVEGHAYNPQWSPGGKWIAFELNRFGDAVDLYLVKIVNGNGSGVPTKIVIPGAYSGFSTRGSVVAAPVWHPEGTVIFEGSNSGGTQRLYYMAPGGQSAAELLDQTLIGGDLTWPSLSDDGSMLVFVSDSKGSGDIFIWQQATNQVVPSFTSPFAEASPRFSPNGATVSFSRKNRGSEDLFLWTSGPTVQPIKGGNGDQSRPAWVGDRIVYFTNERGEGHWDIAVTDKAGSERVILAREVRLPMRASPAISPDGRSVIYTMSDPQQGDRLYATTLDGSTTVEIQTGLVACGEPDLIQTDQGKIYAAFTALPNADTDWRQLHVMDVTGQLP